MNLFLIDKLYVASFLKIILKEENFQHKQVLDIRLGLYPLKAETIFKDENFQHKWVLDARLDLYPLKAEIKDKAGSRWHFRTPPVIKPNMFEAKKRHIGKSRELSWSLL